MTETCKKQQKKKKQRRKEARETEPIVKGWELNYFVVPFLQLIYKASLICKSNLELALSVRRVSKRVSLLMKLNMMNCILLILLFFLLSDIFSFIIYIHKQTNKISRSKKILQVHISYKCIILLPKRS